MSNSVQELRRSATYLTEAETLSHTGCWARNTKTGEMFWSPEKWSIFGLDPATTPLSNQMFIELVHPEDRASLEENSARATRDRRPLTSRFAPCCTMGRSSTSIALASRSKGKVEYIGVTMDETERVHANIAIHEAQAELARVARLTTMGELAASIAHEVKQPLTAVVAYGHATVRWLAHAPPNLDEARAALDGIVREGNRAGEVIDRIRTLLTHRTPVYVGLDLNEAIQDVLTLTGTPCGAAR